MGELNVKVGDRVALYTRGYRRNASITKVTSVTPTGRIKVEDYNNIQFNKYGMEMGQKDSWIPRALLKELTPELEREIKEEEVIRKCFYKMQCVKKLSYMQAVKILEALDELRC